MFGFGNKTWKDNEAWHDETSKRLYVIYDYFLYSISNIWGNVGTLEELKNMMTNVKHDFYYSHPEKGMRTERHADSANLLVLNVRGMDLSAKPLLNRDARDWLKVKNILKAAKNISNWMDKNIPSQSNYDLFRIRHSSIISYILEIYETFPYLSDIGKKYPKLSQKDFEYILDMQEFIANKAWKIHESITQEVIEDHKSIIKKNKQLGVSQSDSEAARLDKLAADQRQVDAQTNLGYMYEEGREVPESDSEAVKLYKLAADQGDADAQYNLGNMYREGLEVTQSDSEAVRLYKLAADQGYLLAQLNLGYMYSSGEGVTQSDSEAAKLYKLAADQGDANAQCNLGVMYDLGNGVTQSDSEAARLYKLAADQDNTTAQDNLGNMYREGKGVTQSYSEARKWLMIAAVQGYAPAQANLGALYAEGLGVIQNYPEAARLFKLAADQGYAVGQFNLGLMYDNGVGVTQSDREAIKYYKLAADQGNEYAKENLEKIKNK